MDTVQYWKQLYAQCQDENTRLRAEIERLQSIQSQKPTGAAEPTLMLEASRTNSAPASMSTSRKKREAQKKMTPADRSRKRMRLSSTSEDATTLSPDADQISVLDDRDGNSHWPYII